VSVTIDLLIPDSLCFCPTFFSSRNPFFFQRDLCDVLYCAGGRPPSSGSIVERKVEVTIDTTIIRMRTQYGSLGSLHESASHVCNAEMGIASYLWKMLLDMSKSALR
jgi:hypothetical protein